VPTSFLNYIAGQGVEAASRATYDVLDPSTGEVYATAPQSDAGDVDAAFRAAQEAFSVWGRMTPAARQKALLGIADAIEARAEVFAAAECRDTGKPRGLFLSEELAVAVDQIRFFAGAARHLNGVSAGRVS
jgi:betaine-aldehyde dehydrogenase